MEGLSPESEPSMECFQNYTAPEVLVQGLAGMVNQQDVEAIIQSQKYMMTRFEKTNEMLVNCNALSSTRFQNGMVEFKKHTQMLTEMRKDVDNIFRRIRAIKAKLASQHPKAYEAAATTQRREKRSSDMDDEEEEDGAVASSNPSSSSSVSRQSTTEKVESDV